MSEQLTRREALTRFGAGAAGLVVTPLSATARGYPRNATIHVGIIGCGGRVLRRLLPRLLKLPGVAVTAVCDVYDKHRHEGNQLVGGKAFTTREHERVLERSDVDAVLIGTPDHWHVPLTVAACAAGKDVFVEKPLTHKLEEGDAVVRAQDEHQRVVQVGTQQRSMQQFIAARELIANGGIGKVHKVHMTWNRNHVPFAKRAPAIEPRDFDWRRFLGSAPDQPFDPYKCLGNWRWFWDFGGGILTDLMVHWLDVVNWTLDLPMPKSAVTFGWHCTTQGVWQTPDTVHTLLAYPEQELIAHFEGTFACQHRRAGITFMGTQASLYVDRGRYTLTPEPRSKVKARELVVGTAEPGADHDEGIDGDTLHLADWLEAIRTRKKPSAPAEAGVLAAAGAHLANQALREGRVTVWTR